MWPGKESTQSPYLRGGTPNNEQVSVASRPSTSLVILPPHLRPVSSVVLLLISCLALPSEHCSIKHASTFSFPVHSAHIIPGSLCLINETPLEHLCSSPGGFSLVLGAIAAAAPLFSLFPPGPAIQRFIVPFLAIQLAFSFSFLLTFTS